MTRPMLEVLYLLPRRPQDKEQAQYTILSSFWESFIYQDPDSVFEDYHVGMGLFSREDCDGP